MSCDGPEDCGGAGQKWCMPSGAHMQTSCTSGNCMVVPGLAMCHGSADCSVGENCCRVTAYGYTYGVCQTGACPQ